MNQTTMVLVSAIISGLLATVITIAWQARAEKIKKRKDIFATLMAYRYRLTHAECVNALNSIQVVFYKDKKVIDAWNKFMDAANSRVVAETFNDVHIQLLEQIALACGYGELHWNEIKSYYYPTGLADEIVENDRLRKANLQLTEQSLQEMSARQLQS